MPERRLPKLTSTSRVVPLPGRPTWLAVTATLILGAGAAGCGSSNKTTTKTTATGISTPAVTKAEFLAKANAICTQGNAQTAAVQAKLGGNPTAAQIAAFEKRTFAPAVQAQIDGIRALGAPAGDQATVTGMLDVAQTDLKKIESHPALLAAGPPFADFAKVAHPYGLTACARNS